VARSRRDQSPEAALRRGLRRRPYRAIVMCVIIRNLHSDGRGFTEAHAIGQYGVEARCPSGTHRTGSLEMGRFSPERSCFGMSRLPLARHQMRLYLVDPPHDRRAVGSEVSYGLALAISLKTAELPPPDVTGKCPASPSNPCAGPTVVHAMLRRSNLRLGPSHSFGKTQPWHL
jgi:hypothetical protein